MRGAGGRSGPGRLARCKNECIIQDSQPIARVEENNNAPGFWRIIVESRLIILKYVRV